MGETKTWDLGTPKPGIWGGHQNLGGFGTGQDPGIWGTPKLGIWGEPKSWWVLKPWGALGKIPKPGDLGRIAKPGGLDDTKILGGFGEGTKTLEGFGEHQNLGGLGEPQDLGFGEHQNLGGFGKDIKTWWFGEHQDLGFGEHQGGGCGCSSLKLSQLSQAGAPPVLLQLQGYFIRVTEQNWRFFLLMPFLVTMELCWEFRAAHPRQALRNIITDKTLQGLFREIIQPTQDLI